MKRGQVTIFIIVGILVVATIVLFFLFRQGIIPGIPGVKDENPEASLDSCIEGKIKETIEVISLQGGYVENTLGLVLDGKNISFLCYTDNYYLPCINQEPVLIQHLKKEIKKGISMDVKNCFDSLTNSLSKKGYAVDADYRDFEIILAPGRVIVDIDAELSLTKANEFSKEENFVVAVPSRIYDLGIVAQEIVAQEAKWCNFETVGFMLLYNDFNIKKFETGELNTVYTITHKKTGEEFKFAVRGCVIPPGF